MVLALLYRSECKTVESKLPNYKIFPIEPSYNIPGHNKNIYDQSPCHLVKEEKNILEHVITAFFFKEKEHHNSYNILPRKSSLLCRIIVRNNGKYRNASLC